MSGLLIFLICIMCIGIISLFMGFVIRRSITYMDYHFDVYYGRHLIGQTIVKEISYHNAYRKCVQLYEETYPGIPLTYTLKDMKE